MPAHLNLIALSARVPEPIGYWNFSQICDLSYHLKADGIRRAYFLNESWLFARARSGWKCRRPEHPEPRTCH